MNRYNCQHAELNMGKGICLFMVVSYRAPILCQRNNKCPLITRANEKYQLAFLA